MRLMSELFGQYLWNVVLLPSRENSQVSCHRDNSASVSFAPLSWPTPRSSFDNGVLTIIETQHKAIGRP